MGQMDLGAHLGQHVDRPIPAERGFDHHLRLRARRGDRLGQRQRIVDDLGLRHQLASGVFVHDHRPATVQVDTHILFVHGNLLSS
jgi:hypothetical protein